MSDGGQLRWTTQQRAVIDLPVDARALVVADAGTGKTAVLVQRLARLVEEGGLAPGSDVLVLSFTRAVVDEIRRRLRERSGWVPLVAPRTFDSFATRLLGEVDPGGEWLDVGYDGRIEAAVELLERGKEAQEMVQRYQHVFVDEIQDLMGVRANLVEGLLSHSGCGFTVFGDPAQAIYDYQSSGKTASMFERVRTRYGPDLVQLSMDENHRAETALTRQVIQIGEPLSKPSPPYEEVGAQLLDLAGSLHDLGPPERAAPALKRAQGSTAILTRDNGHALLTSEKLWDADVAHRLQRSASDRAVVPWVARTFRMSQHQTTGKTAVQEALARELPDTLDPEEGWRLLKQLDRSGGNRLELPTVRTSIARRLVPRELARPPEAILTVSTTHRAKGLEFDNVVLLRTGGGLEDFLSFEDRDELASEVRVLYVALSRPRREIMRLCDKDYARIGVDPRTKRWFKRGRERWQTFGFEVDVDDVDRSAPPGATLVDGDPVETQHYLWSEVEPGDPVELHFVRASIAGPVEVTYAVQHGDRAIGVTSPGFGKLLHSRLHGGRKKGRWPKRIHKLRVEGVETTAGPPGAGINAGLGVSGLWLRPRLIGLGEIEW
jgi:hypothetical protein